MYVLLLQHGVLCGKDIETTISLFLQNPEDSTPSGGGGRRLPLPVQPGPAGGRRMHTDEAAQV